MLSTLIFLRKTPHSSRQGAQQSSISLEIRMDRGCSCL